MMLALLTAAALAQPAPDSLRDAGRTDEAVAILAGRLGDPEAAVALAQILLNAPPRLAWLPTAAALAEAQPSPLVQAWHQRIRLADPAQRADARRKLDRLRRDNPNDRRIRQMAAEARMFADDLGPAIAVDASAVPGDCRQPATVLGCVQALDARGAADIAAARLTLAMPELPEHIRAAAHAELARLAALRGDADAELEHLRSALQLRPGEPMYRQRTLDAYLWQYRVEEAEAIALTPAERAAVEATALIRDSTDDASALAALTLAPTQPRVLAARAQRLLEGGDGASAAPLLKTAIERAGPKADLLNLTAWAATSGGSVASAISAFQVSLASAPDAATWQARLTALSDMLVVSAEADKAAGRTGPAAEHYAHAAALTPERASVWMGYGGALWASGDMAGAERAYRAAFARAPEDREALMSLVGLLRASGQSDEAYALVEGSSIDDAQIRALEAELVVLAAARPAEEAAEAGRIDEALARYQALELAYPGHPELLHRLADLRAANGEHDAAISLYLQAQRKAPDNPWLFIGEARSSMALGDLDLAEEVLDMAPLGADADATAEAGRLRRAIQRQRADQLAASDPAAALSMYADLMAAAPDDVWTLAAIAGLYAQDQQPSAALLFFDEAIAADGVGGTADFRAGRMAAQLALGRHDEALEDASRAYRETGDERYLAHAREAERQLQLQRVTELINDGRLELAEVSLRRRLEVVPDDVEARTVLAALLLATDRPQDAFDQAVATLGWAPGDADALTVLRRAGDALGRADAVLPYYTRAGASWAQREADILALDAALTAAVRDPKPAPAIEAVARQYAGDSPRRWVMVGGAWLEADEPEAAQDAFMTALTFDPHSTDAARGLAGALQAQGQGERAADVLRLLWRDSKDPIIGGQLTALLADLGRPVEAREIRRQLDAMDQGSAPPASSSVSSLPVLRPPSGATAERAVPAPTPLAAVFALEPEDDASDDSGAGTGHVEALLQPAQIRRPGEVGAQQLTVQFLTLGVEWTPPVPVWAGAAVIPMRVSDGETVADGVIPGGWIGIGGGQLGLEVSAAPTPLQLDPEPRLTGRVELLGRPVPSISVSLTGAQAAATDTTTSWFGKDGAGRAMDRWLGTGLVWGGGAISAGGQARFGETSAIQLDSLPWQQAQLWMHASIVDEPEGQIGGHLEATALQHDAQVDGFDIGEAAIFSPLGYYAALGRVELERDFTRWGACTHVALGPQQIVGEETLYLGPGTYLGYRLEGGLWLALTDKIDARAGYRLEGTWGRWYQELALLQITTGGGASTHASMRLPAGSPVHGIPITAQGPCGGRP